MGEKEPPSGNRTVAVILPIALFVFGVVEYVLLTKLTDSIASARRMAASIAVFFYVLLWYVVGRAVILGQPELAMVYALGCAVGTWITCPVSGHVSTRPRKSD